MKILVLDDDDIRHAYFKRALAKDNDLVQVHTHDEAIYQLETVEWDLVYLDHDLNDHRYKSIAPEPNYDGGAWELTGSDVARFISTLPQEKLPKEVVVHSWNPAGASRMLAFLRDVGIKCSYRPFHGAGNVLVEEDHIEPDPYVTNRR